MWLAEAYADGRFHVLFRACRRGKATDMTNDGTWTINGANSGDASAAIASPKFTMVLGPFNKTEFFVGAGYGIPTPGMVEAVKLLVRKMLRATVLPLSVPAYSTPLDVPKATVMSSVPKEPLPGTIVFRDQVAPLLVDM